MTVIGGIVGSERLNRRKRETTLESNCSRYSSGVAGRGLLLFPSRAQAVCHGHDCPHSVLTFLLYFSQNVAQV
jgi:hypothetical protein